MSGDQGNIGSVVGRTDPGSPMLLKHAASSTRLTSSEGDYDIARLSEFGAVLTEPEQHIVIDEMDALVGNGGTWAAIDTDTSGVALSTKHVLGTGSIEFDKVNSGASSGIGGITKALTALNLSGASPHDILQTVIYVDSTTNLDGGSSYIFLRLGTDSTNYNEWRIDSVGLTAGIWETIAFEIGDASFVGQGGAGITWTAITYIAVGFKFDGVNDELPNIYVDEISFHTNQHVNAVIGAEITTDISSANINILKIGNKVVNTQNGTVSTGTQRITIASDSSGMTALNGSETAPSIDSFHTIPINVAAGGPNTLVADPGANKQIWIYGIVAIANVAGTMVLQDDGSPTALSGIMSLAATGGFVVSPTGNFAMPWIKGTTSQAVDIVTVTCTIDGTLTYAIVSV